MKAVISTDNGNVSAHFGRCPQFTVVEYETGKITNKEVIDNPGHSPGFLPEYFAKMEANCIIAGGMGPKAQDLFNEKNIEQIIGISGSIDSAIKQLVAGELKSGTSLCDEGGGKGYGVDKNTCDHE